MARDREDQREACACSVGDPRVQGYLGETTVGSMGWGMCVLGAMRKLSGEGCSEKLVVTGRRQAVVEFGTNLLDTEGTQKRGMHGRCAVGGG